MSVQTVCDWCSNTLSLEAIVIGSINQGSLDSDNQAQVNPAQPTLTRHFHPYCWQLFYSNAQASSPPKGGPVPQPPLSPLVTSISPTSGSTAGGTTVVLRGQGFTGATAVHFGTHEATSFTVDSDLQITAASPVVGPSSVDITVTGPGGTSPTDISDQFQFVEPQPVVTGLSPASGSPAGGSSVIISGSGFTGASAVKFGSTSATFNGTSDTQITATLPSGTASSTVDVTVTTPNGTSATVPADQFSYLATVQRAKANGKKGKK